MGSKNKKRVWDGKKELIVSRLLSGVSRKRAAQEAGISVVSLYNFLAQNPEVGRLLQSKNAENRDHTQYS